MKKIKLSVAALLIAMTSHGQLRDNDGCSYPAPDYEIPTSNLVTDLKSQNFKIDEVIDAIRMDMYYGYLEKQRGMYYVNELIAIKRDNEINIVLLTRNKEE